LIGAVFEVISIAASILGLVVAAKGTAKTQSVLRKGNQNDAVINAMAWFDRRFLNGQKLEKPASQPR